MQATYSTSIIFGLFVVAFIILYLYLKLKFEIQSLAKILQKTPKLSLNFYQNFSTKDARRLYQIIYSRTGQKDREIQLMPTYQEVVQESKTLNDASYDIDKLAKRVRDLLFKNLFGEIQALVILISDDPTKTDSVRILYLEGVEKKRVEQILLSQYETLKNSENWGFIDPPEGSIFDFEKLGINNSLMVPLRSQERTLGAIWIGFKKGNVSIDSSQRLFTQVICEHAASCFNATLQEKNYKKDLENEKKYLVSLSHDIRSPGNNAQFIISDLLEGASGLLTEEQFLKLKLLRSCLNEQESLIVSMLDYVKYKRGLFRPNNRLFSINENLKEVINAFDLRAKKNQLTISFTESQKDLFVRFDSGIFGRIAHNLISNAIKYAPGKELKIYHQETDSSFVELVFQDNGQGISPEADSQLFQEFKQFENNAQDGWGLGLSICKNFAEDCGGYLKYEFANPGAKFILGLPIESELKEVAPGRRTGLNLEGIDHTTSIMLIDDDEIVLKAVYKALKDNFANLVMSGNLEEAKQLLKKAQPNIIILDLYFGENSSENFLSYLKSNYPKIQVILLTGSIDIDLIENLKIKYNIQWLEKPVSREELNKEIKKITSQSV